MATITRNAADPVVEKIRSVLDQYEHQHPGAAAALYRQSSVSIRIRIISDSYANRAKADRHDEVWDFLAARLDDEAMADISILLLLSPDEKQTSLMNMEFDHPITPSRL